MEVGVVCHTLKFNIRPGIAMWIHNTQPFRANTAGHLSKSQAGEAVVFGLVSATRESCAVIHRVPLGRASHLTARELRGRTERRNTR